MIQKSRWSARCSAAWCCDSAPDSPVQKAASGIAVAACAAAWAPQTRACAFLSKGTQTHNASATTAAFCGQVTRGAAAAREGLANALLAKFGRSEHAMELQLLKVPSDESRAAHGRKFWEPAMQKETSTRLRPFAQSHSKKPGLAFPIVKFRP